MVREVVLSCMNRLPCLLEQTLLECDTHSLGDLTKAITLYMYLHQAVSKYNPGHNEYP